MIKHLFIQISLFIYVRIVSVSMSRSQDNPRQLNVIEIFCIPKPNRAALVFYAPIQPVGLTYETVLKHSTV
jgi:hypothetical protein